MAKLKLGAIDDDKPVKVTVELPAAVHQDLVAYAVALSGETGQTVPDAAKLIGPMLARYMGSDRAFRKLRRVVADGAASVGVLSLSAENQIGPSLPRRPDEVEREP